MKKFFYVISILVCAILLSACGKETSKTVLNKISNKMNKTSGYKMEAAMELINNEDVFKYDVSVSYKKSDMFRVSLRNKTNNHEQIILKNKDGVYVLTPSLNKSFKFQSKWPYNNSQSYLLQSVVNDLKNDASLSMEKKNGNYVFKSKVNFKNNKKLKYQIVIFDNKLKIKSVRVYDKDDNIAIKVNFKSVDMNAKFRKNYFELEENMETSLSAASDVENTGALEEAVYPMYLPEGTYLEKEKSVNLDNGSRIILTFNGDRSFMLVEEASVKEDEMTVIPTSGDLDIFGDKIAIVDDSSVSFISDNVEYYLVSSTMSKTELLEVAKSMAQIPLEK